MLKAVKDEITELKSKCSTSGDTRFAAGWSAALTALSKSEAMTPMLKATIQIEVSIPKARKFIEQLSTQGYVPVQEPGSDEFRESWYFKVHDQTSIDFQVTILGEQETAFIGIRPH